MKIVLTPEEYFEMYPHLEEGVDFMINELGYNLYDDFWDIVDMAHLFCEE
jgi:hypothetical protein